jgi:hypothetical protein
MTPFDEPDCVTIVLIGILSRELESLWWPAQIIILNGHSRESGNPVQAMPVIAL